MIGWLQQEQQGGSAWAQVEAAQRQVHLPCLLVPQPAHAVLAGQLAAGLTCFGELPAEIKQAIQMHDTGWAASDAQQIQRLRSPHAGHALPVSFLAISPAEAEEAWTASIDAVRTFSSTGAAVVSRHFSLLAQHDPAQHRHFLQAQKSRMLEDSANIERWTAALGFCDLVSLYLLSGCRGPVEFPLAHPSSPEAKTAPRVKMQGQDRKLRFSPEAVRAGCTLSIQAMKHPLPAQGSRAETLTWELE